MNTSQYQAQQITDSHNRVVDSLTSASDGENAEQKVTNTSTASATRSSPVPDAYEHVLG